MNAALLSSKNMNWCTPIDFFNRLDAEFHFVLDVAATDATAKCKNYFTPRNGRFNTIVGTFRRRSILQPAVWTGDRKVG